MGAGGRGGRVGSWWRALNICDISRSYHIVMRTAVDIHSSKLRKKVCGLKPKAMVRNRGNSKDHTEAASWLWLARRVSFSG